MFLSKKNAEYLNKPAKGRKIEPRVLPGWADDDDTESNPNYKPEPKHNGQHKNPDTTNLLFEAGSLDVPDNEPAHERTKQTNKKSLYNWDQLNDMNNIECEKRLVEGIVEPGGVKVKPTQNLLTEFVKECKSMDPVIVGSLLLSKLEVNYPFLVKAKSLYTIEHLIKKNPTYLNYFKAQTESIKGFPQPEDNVDNYRKILKNVLNYIGVAAEKSEVSNENAISFVDPGYNDPKEESQIRGFLSNNEKTKKAVGPNTKKFISPTDAKKGPQPQHQEKKQDIFDIFADQPSTGTKSKTETGFDDLILMGPSQPQTKQPKQDMFDDLLR